MNRSSSNGQLGFHFRIDHGLPLAVSRRSIERQARREFISVLVAADDPDLFGLRRYVEKVALLRELRRRYRTAVRGEGRKGSAAVYAGTPEGRRIHRVMDRLALEIAAERT